MGIDDAIMAYRVVQAEARMAPTIIVKARERRERRIESAAAVDHAALGRLAGLRDELRHRGIIPPEVRATMAPRP